MCCRTAKITFSSAVLLNLKINYNFQTQREFPISGVSETVSDKENVEVSSCPAGGGESLKILPSSLIFSSLLTSSPTEQSCSPKYVLMRLRS